MTDRKDPYPQMRCGVNSRVGQWWGAEVSDGQTGQG